VQIYRVAQEALSNIARHSGASHVHVAWTLPERGRGKLLICDDGRGFDPEGERPGHFGVGNMRERAEELGASFSVASRPGEGTHIELELSWEAP
jgi:signal transduction histidine kinase